MSGGSIVKELKRKVELALQDGTEVELANAYEPARVLFMTDTCIDILTKLHEILPEDDKYTLALADAWTQVGDFDRADELYSAEEDSTSPSVKLSRGDSLRVRGRYDEAAELYLKANEMFKSRFDHVIFMSTDFRNPAEEKLDDIYHLLSDKWKKKVLSSISVTLTGRDMGTLAHFTPPMMINSTLIKDILMERYPTIVPVTLKSEGEDPKEIKTYIDPYLDYINANPLDTYAAETAARMLDITGSQEKARAIFDSVRSVYEEKSTMLGELQMQSRHYLQLCLRLEKQPKSNILDTAALWNPADALVTAFPPSQ